MIFTLIGLISQTMDKVKKILYTGLKKIGMSITFGAYDMCLISDYRKLIIIKKLADTLTYETKGRKESKAHHLS